MSLGQKERVDNLLFFGYTLPIIHVGPGESYSLGLEPRKLQKYAVKTVYPRAGES